MRGVLRRLSDQPSEWHERERGENEQTRVAEVKNVVSDERERHEGERAPEDLSCHVASVPSVLRAVLFDWGDTLMAFGYEPELVEAGHRAALKALARDDVPESAEITAHFRERYEPMFWLPGTLEEIEYPGLVRELLG